MSDLSVKNDEHGKMLYNKLIHGGVDAKNIDRLASKGRVNYFLIKNPNEKQIKLLNRLKEDKYFTDMIPFVAYHDFLIIL